MNKILAALILTFALTAPAVAQDYRTGNQALVSGVVGYPSTSESPARVSVSGTTARTATAFPAFSYVRIYCDADVSIKFGDNTVTATTADMRVPAMPEVFNSGSGTYVAFITTGGTGACDITVLR